MRALITGASSGIGRDMARVMSGRGFDLVLVARDEKRLYQLASQLPVHTQVIPMDLSEPRNCIALYERMREDCPDVVINNAGFGIFGPFDETDLERELNLIDLNIKAVHILTKLFAAEMKRQDHGFILNVSSSAAFFAGPLLSSYYASKAYVLRLTQAIHEELRKSGSKVHVCALCPGPVDTEFNQRAGVSFSLRGMESQEVAVYAINQMFRRKLVIIPGITMKLAKFGSRFAPDELVTRIAYHFQHRKQNR